MINEVPMKVHTYSAMILKLMYCVSYDDVEMDNLMADINEAISNTNSIPRGD